MDANYREPVSGALPVSYSILSLPPKSEMRKKGYDPDHVFFNGSVAHPLATWKSFTLPPGASYKDALLKLQEANKKPWGLMRARLHFSDGQIEMFERRDPRSPMSFCNVRTYDPNGVFRQVTGEAVAKSRRELQPLLEVVSDERGHSLKPLPHPRTFAPEVLFKSCPPPVHSQCGYDFTPISHASFLLKPSNPPKGFRKTMSAFEHRPCDYRPHAFLKPRPPESRHCHCGEVFQVGDYTLDLACEADVIDHRNRLEVKKYNSLRMLQPNSLIVGKRNARDPRFPCKEYSGGGRAAPRISAEDHYSGAPQYNAPATNEQQNSKEPHHPLCPQYNASATNEQQNSKEPHHPLCPQYNASATNEQQNSKEPHHPLCPQYNASAERDDPRSQAMGGKKRLPLGGCNRDAHSVSGSSTSERKKVLPHLKKGNVRFAQTNGSPGVQASYPPAQKRYIDPDAEGQGFEVGGTGENVAQLLNHSRP